MRGKILKIKTLKQRIRQIGMPIAFTSLLALSERSYNDLSNLSTVSPERLRDIELVLNAKPKPSRGNYSSSDLWLMEIHARRQTLH